MPSASLWKVIVVLMSALVVIDIVSIIRCIKNCTFHQWVQTVILILNVLIVFSLSLVLINIL